MQNRPEIQFLYLAHLNKEFQISLETRLSTVCDVCVNKPRIAESKNVASLVMNSALLK